MEGCSPASAPIRARAPTWAQLGRQGLEIDLFPQLHTHDSPCLEHLSENTVIQQKGLQHVLSFHHHVDFSPLPPALQSFHTAPVVFEPLTQRAVTKMTRTGRCCTHAVQLAQRGPREHLQLFLLQDLWESLKGRQNAR